MVIIFYYKSFPVPFETSAAWYIPEIVVESIILHPQLNHAVRLLPPVINGSKAYQ